MAYCCSQCSFTAQFESALMMHHQLHHENSDSYPVQDTPALKEKSHTLPRVSPPSSPASRSKNKGVKNSLALPSRSTSSATRLFDRFKARISKSRTFFSHPEADPSSKSLSMLASKCETMTSKESKQRGLHAISEDRKEIYCCHLCPFDADRITVLDRHLLNHHKIGLENLLKLVMAKTKDGLCEDDSVAKFGIREPYYKPDDEIIEEGEFIIETVMPKIKILKHASTNTDHHTATNLSEEIEYFLTNGEGSDANLLGKMKALDDYMSKFVCSSNALRKALDSQVNVKDHDGFSSVRLGEAEKSKATSDSLYF